MAMVHITVISYFCQMRGMLDLFLFSTIDSMGPFLSGEYLNPKED